MAQWDIKVVTKRDVILSVAQRWNNQYRSKQWDGTDKRAIGQAIRALDLLTATEDDVASIIGNRSWTRLQCDQCEREVERVVQIAGTNEYGPDNLCETCLRQAVALLEEADRVKDNGYYG